MKNLSLSGRRFLKNSLSNIITGLSSAVLAIVLPYFLVRGFSATEFSIWVLALQLGASVNYLNLGIQIAIGRYIAFALGRNDEDYAQEILTAGIQILMVLAGLGLLVIICLLLAFPFIFSSVPNEMLGVARETLLWVGGSLAIGLPFTAYLGVFVGLQRNELPAMISMVSKTILGIALIFVAYGHNLPWMGRVYFLINIITYIAQYVLFTKVRPKWHINGRPVTSAARRELILYCAGLTAWSFAMLLINAISPALVGVFDFRAVGAFGTAFTAMTFLFGLVGAIFNPLLQIFAQLHAREEFVKEGALLEFSAFFCSLSLIAGACGLISIARPMFGLWIGPDMAEIALPIFILLLIGNLIRNTQTPYALYLIATNQQQKVLLGALADGFGNFLASIIAVQIFHANGVAFGAIVGSMATIGVNYWRYYSITLPRDVNPIVYTRNTLLKPLLYTTPLILISTILFLAKITLVWSVLAMIVAYIPYIVFILKNIDGLRVRP